MNPNQASKESAVGTEQTREPFLSRIRNLVSNAAHINRLATRINNLENAVNDLLSRPNTTEVRIAEKEGLNETIKNLQSDVTMLVCRQKEQERFRREYHKYEEKDRMSSEKEQDSYGFLLQLTNEVWKKNKDPLFVVDLGCGQGEWLKKISDENGIVVLGVDSDAGLIDICEKNGLNAVRAESYSYLKQCASEAIDILTILHTAELMPMERLCALFQECYRVLKPGGVFVLENRGSGSNGVKDRMNSRDENTGLFPPELLDYYLRKAGFKEISRNCLSDQGRSNAAQNTGKDKASDQRVPCPNHCFMIGRKSEEE